MGYFADATIAAFKASFNLGVFFRLGTSPALHMSFSVNDIPIQMPGLDAVGTVYQGGGRLQNIPALELMVNGLSSKVSFTLNGVDSTLAQMMLDSAPEVLGAPVTVGICPMDQYFQPVGAITAMWTGTAEYVSEEITVERDIAKPQTQSLALIASAGDTSRAFSSFLTFTDAAHRAIFATDSFFDRVSRQVVGYRVTWPRF